VKLSETGENSSARNTGSKDRSETAPPGFAASLRRVSKARHGLLVGATGIVFVVGTVLRFASPVHLWFDEVLTVNIARLPLADLAGALRHDGAPPLFYAALHLWSRLFGDSDVASRALPGVLGVLMIPLAYTCGRSIAARANVDAGKAGISAALITAVSPFAILFSTETRMYTLAMLLILLGHLALWRALESPTPRRLALVAGVTAALLYTHYWCVFLVVVVLAVLVVRSLSGSTGDRHAARAAAAAVVGGCALFTPWIPTLLWQLRHTGTPWGGRPRIPIVVVTTLTQFAGGHHLDGRVLTVLLALLATIGFWGRSLGGSSVGRSQAARRSRGARWECLVGAATLVVGLTVDVVTNSAYQTRYAAVVFPFFVLAAGHGAALLGRKVRIVVLAVVVGLGISTSFHAITMPRTQAGEIAAAVRAGAHDGDVVVYCPDQLAPDTSHLLPASPKIRQFTFPGFGPPDRVDWTDYAARNRAADPDTFATELVARTGPADIWLVSSPGYLTYGDKCEQLQAALEKQRGPAVTLVQSSAVFEHMSLIRFGS
jgi:mannosyltransferase